MNFTIGVSKRAGVVTRAVRIVALNHKKYDLEDNFVLLHALHYFNVKPHTILRQTISQGSTGILS